MKVTAIHRTPGASVEVFPCISHYPGSAVFHGGKPFFVPDISSEWVATPTIALRLCRLGKSIDKRFASRYYDAAAPALLFIPADVKRMPGMDGLISAIDNTLAIGPWQPLPDDGIWRLDWLGETINIDSEAMAADEAIAALSRFMSIQMGDALLPVTIDASVPVVPEKSISLTLNGHDTFTVRTK